MALTPVDEVRFLIGLGPTSPFYDLVSNEEIEWALERTNGNVIAAARLVAISLSFQLAGYNTRERVGDEEIWNSVSTSYLKALENFINDPAVLIPNGLMPWSANSCPSKLMNIEVCDGDNCKELAECFLGVSSCGCSDCHSNGETF